MKEKGKKYILWLKEISAKDVALVGGKNAALGEIYRGLTPVSFIEVCPAALFPRIKFILGDRSL